MPEDLYARVRQREREDPALVRPVLELLASPVATAPVDEKLVGLAARLAEQRADQALTDFVARSLTTAEVIARVRRWNSRKTVAAARLRGQLLGLTVGRETYHPDWQFTAGDVRPGVEQIHGPLLDAAAGDILLADLIMRQARPEFDGRALTDLLAAGRIDDVLRLLDRYIEGFAP